MKVVKAFFMCLGMFSAIPCPYRPWDEDSRGLMTACLPLVGALIGGIWYVLSCVGNVILPNAISAALIAFLPFLLTGFMHLDGFMDTCDAILSWRPLEQRQKILKDVHCGAFAVVGAVLLVLSMFAAVWDVRTGDLRPCVLIPVVSRCCSAFCVTFFRPIGHSEYAALQRNMGTPITSVVLLLLSFVISAVWCGGHGVVCVLATLLGYGLAMAHAARMLDGVSGDLAGYALCVGELCGLIATACI